MRPARPPRGERVSRAGVSTAGCSRPRGGGCGRVAGGGAGHPTGAL